MQLVEPKNVRQTTKIRKIMLRAQIEDKYTQKEYTSPCVHLIFVEVFEAESCRMTVYRHETVPDTGTKIHKN